MTNYKITIDYHARSQHLFGAIILLHLPFQGLGTCWEYQSPTEDLLGDTLRPGWGYASEDYPGFVNRRAQVYSPTRKGLQESVQLKVLEIKLALHRIWKENNRLSDPIELDIDPSIDPIERPVL